MVRESFGEKIAKFLGLELEYHFDKRFGLKKRSANSGGKYGHKDD